MKRISTDGRINSSMDEEIIIKSLINKFGDKIKRKPDRYWYDILVDDKYPVNIKSTTMKTADNTGNLTMCLYAYTNENMCLSKNYNNGEVADKLNEMIKKNLFNRNYTRDYYFLVIDKTNTRNIIINSVNGLSVLCSNVNNLPYQVCWAKNKKYNPKPITENVRMFIHCFKYKNEGYKQRFLRKICTIDI